MKFKRGDKVYIKLSVTEKDVRRWHDRNYLVEDVKRLQDNITQLTIRRMSEFEEWGYEFEEYDKCYIPESFLTKYLCDIQYYREGVSNEN